MSSNDDIGVYYHVDYKSKADMRRKELDELRKRSIANAQATRLADAEAPTTDMMLHFQEKQRQLFVQQRRNQAAAMEYLHQYRADDERILTEQRRISAGKGGRNSLDHPVLTPDARAATYSYEQMATDLPFAESSKQLDDNPQADAHASEPPNTALTDRFQTRHETFEMGSTMNAEKSAIDSISHGEETTLICEGCSAEEDNTMPEPTTSSIPFESFLRLGESQIMGGIQQQESNEELHESTTILQGSTENNCTDSDGDDSIIPIESFMKLGASMMAEAIIVSKSEDEIKQNDNHTDDDVTASLTEAGQSHMEDSSSLAASMSQQHPTAAAATAAAPTSTSPIHEATESEDVKKVVEEKFATMNPNGLIMVAEPETDEDVDDQARPEPASQERLDGHQNEEEDAPLDNQMLLKGELLVEKDNKFSSTEIQELETESQTDTSLVEASTVPERTRPTPTTLLPIDSPSNNAMDPIHDALESNVQTPTSQQEAFPVDDTMKNFSGTPFDNVAQSHDETKENDAEGLTIKENEIEDIYANTVQEHPEEHIAEEIPTDLTNNSEDSPVEAVWGQPEHIVSDRPTAARDIGEEAPASHDAFESSTNSTDVVEENIQTTEQVNAPSTSTADGEAHSRRRRRKTKVGYYPASSHFVSRHYFSR